MSSNDEKVTCRTPTPGKQATRIDRWKYDTVRKAILKALPRRGDGLSFSELPLAVENLLTPAQLQRLGSIMWYVTTVKLDLEVRGEIERVSGARPQRLRRSDRR